MPDASGRIPPVAYSLSTEQWERIFGCGCEHPLDCENRDVGCQVEAILRDAQVDFRCARCGLSPDEFCSEDDCPL